MWLPRQVPEFRKVALRTHSCGQTLILEHRSRRRKPGEQAGQETSSSKARAALSPSQLPPFCHPRSFLSCLGVPRRLHWVGRQFLGVARGGPKGQLLPKPARESAPQPSHAGQRPRQRRAARLGRGLLLSGARGGGGRVSHAPRRVPPANPALLACPERPPSASGWAGPAGSRRSATGSPSSPHSPRALSASQCSSAPAPSPPPQPPKRVLSLPFSLSLSSRPGSRARCSGLGRSARTDTSAHSPPAATACAPRVPRLAPASGSRARTPPRPAASRAAGAASPGRRRTGRGRLSLPPLRPAHLALALSRGPRRARSRPRAPSSRFSRLLSVR